MKRNQAGKKSPASKPPPPPSPPAGAEADVIPQLEYLTHELQVHQEELDIQNRQLVASQRSLEESRDRYASLYDFTPVACVTLCRHGVIRDINLTGADMLGYPRENLVDRPFVLFVAQPYRRTFLAHLSHCGSGDPILTTELMLLGRDREQIAVELRTSKHPLRGQSELVFLSALVDITARQRLEQERERLREAVRGEQLLRTILETLPVAVRVVGRGGEAILFNEACRALWGISAGASLPAWDHQTGWNPGHRPLAAEEWPVSIALRQRKPVLRQMIHVQGFDGTMRVVLQSAVPLIDASGDVTGAVEVTEDVTRLLAAQETARHRQEQLQTAFDAAHLSAWDWDLTHDRVTWSGPFQQYFVPNKDAESGTPGDFLKRVHPEDVAALRAGVKEANERGGVVEHEFRIVLDDGKMRWLSANGRFTYANGRAMRMSGIVRDITVRKDSELELLRAKEAAEQASRLKDDFLATVSHELRTPLSAILLWAHLARTTLKSPEEFSEAVETIQQSAKAQAQIVDDLLDISRGIAGKLRVNLRPVSLAEPVRAAMETVRPAADTRQVRLEAELNENMPPIQIDPDRVRQVAWNLLSNAIKFTPSGGTVRIHIDQVAGDDRPMARLTVSDTGQGIAREFLPHVFDRFRQAESGLTRMYGGLGLGLAIARELVQMHGGIIRADSDGPGKGATFTVDLPMAAESPAARAPAPSQPHATERLLEGLDLMLVEDNQDTRVALDLILKSAGATVRSFASGVEAIEAFEADPPDVLISDLAMPDLDGFELLRKLRQIESQLALPPSGKFARCRLRPDGTMRPTPALALTAHALPEDRARAIAAGFQAHLAKPIDPPQLIAAVSAICDENKIERAGRKSRAEAPGNGQKFADPMHPRRRRRSATRGKATEVR